jgi:hypothetical protein
MFWLLFGCRHPASWTASPDQSAEVARLRPLAGRVVWMVGCHRASAHHPSPSFLMLFETIDYSLNFRKIDWIYMNLYSQIQILGLADRPIYWKIDSVWDRFIAAGPDTSMACKDGMTIDELQRAGLCRCHKSLDLGTKPPSFHWIPLNKQVTS